MYSKNALVVDDSLTARTVLKHQLNQFDVIVESACDGSHALELLRSHTPDVIFLDHIMPGLDGFEVLALLKENQSTRSIPVVMYTSQAAPQYTIEAKLLGAIAVIPKKVTNEQLMEALDKAELYQLSAADTAQDAIADADAQLTDALNKAEIYQFAIAGADSKFAGAANQEFDNHSETQTTSSSPAGAPSEELATAPAMPAMAASQAPDAVLMTAAPTASESGFDTVQSDGAVPVQKNRSWLLALLVAVLVLVQGYSMLRNQTQLDSFNGLHQQSLLQQKSFNNLRLQVIQQQQLIDGLRLQVAQQEELVPDMQAQLASEQRELAESTWRQLEFLMTVLMDQVQAGSTTD